MRRTIMRYVNLAFVVTLTCISPCVKKRFPTLDHLVEAGILLPNEKKIIEQLKTTHSTYWMPLVWASSIATRARKEGRIRDDFALKTVIDAIAHYRSLCGGLFNYDWISIPLVYTQVVTLVVYTFFLSTLMGRQYLDPDQGYRGYEVDLYIPIFNFLQFFFYMGWLKVAETLVNPFGEDDDDFEVNWVIDRDIQVSYLIVDDMHQEHPELIKDQYWDEVMPDLPYTAAAKPFYSEPPQGSAASLIVPAHEAEFVPLETLVEDSVDDRLEDVKVDGALSVPVNASDRRKRFSRNYSESSQSSISGLGRSYHPHSQQRRTVISLLHRLFSQEHGHLGSNSSLQSRRSKCLRKDDSRDSNISPSSNPSIPPTPSEYRTRLHGFPDDIFHLSDLSLADSRGTSVAQSPGIFSMMQMTDMFGRLKPERPHRFPLQTQLSQSKGGAPVNFQGEKLDGESRSQSESKKRRTNSLKYFFRSGSKQLGSQKSLVDSVHTEPPEKLKTPSTNSMEVDDSVQATLVPGEKNDDDSADSIQEEIFDEEEANILSSVNIGSRKDSIFSQESFSHSQHSLSQVMPPSSNEKSENLNQVSSSETLFDKNEVKDSNLTESASSEKAEEHALGDAKPCSQKPTPLIYRRIFSSLKPKRAVSLLIHDVNNTYTKTQSGMSKFYRSKKHHKIIHTGSQPATPTEHVSLHPKLRLKSVKDIFRQTKNPASFKVKQVPESVRSSAECPEIIISSQNIPCATKDVDGKSSAV